VQRVWGLGACPDKRVSFLQQIYITVLTDNNNSSRNEYKSKSNSGGSRRTSGSYRSIASSFHNDSTQSFVNNEPHIHEQPYINESATMYEESEYEKERSTAPLQDRGNADQDHLEPLTEDDPSSYDLVAPPEEGNGVFSLERRSELLSSSRHLRAIFSDPGLFLRFTKFLTQHRAASVPLLVYYLDATKALKAISYANAIAESLKGLEGYEFTNVPARLTINATLEEKATKAFDALARDDLAAYITNIYVAVVSATVTHRITGTLSPELRAASEGLAEVFCLTDPSRPDNPIVFASEGNITEYQEAWEIG
jgi:hypothetical protein